MRLGAIAATLAVNVALAAGLAYLWSDTERSRWTEPAALPPSLEDLAAAPASEPTDVARYRETVERPLFAVNRRPAPKKDPETEAQASADSLKDVRLLGTYGTGERGGIIVVRGGKVERLAVGESIGGWKVAGGGAGRAAELVRADGQRRELELALNNVAPAAPSAAGKGSAPDTPPQAAAAEQVRPAEATAPATSQRASSARAGPRARTQPQQMSPEARQQRLDQINQRRAARGLPPLLP
jgi:hypothetical protein